MSTIALSPDEVMEAVFASLCAGDLESDGVDYLSPEQLANLVRQEVLTDVERSVLAGYVSLAGALESELETHGTRYVQALDVPESFLAECRRVAGRLRQNGLTARTLLSDPPDEIADLIVNLACQSLKRSDRVPLSGLESVAYEHPADRTALAAFKALPGVSDLVQVLLQNFQSRQADLTLLANTIEVTSMSLPTLDRQLRETCEILDIADPPRLYLDLHATGPYTTGTSEPIIVIPSIWVDRLIPSELNFILGHELGHVKAGHFLYHTLARVLQGGGQLLGDLTLGLGRLLSDVALGPTLLTWCRRSELTADRAGYLACQNRETAIQAMMKAVGMPARYAGEANTRAYITQARMFDEKLGKSTLQRLLLLGRQLQGNHPFMTIRLLELLDFVEYGDYQDLIDTDAAGRRAIARRCSDDPKLQELLTTCSRVMANWASESFEVPRSLAGRLVRGILYEQKPPPPDTPLAGLLRGDLRIQADHRSQVRYSAVLRLHRDQTLFQVTIPIPLDPAWERLPAELRDAFLRQGGDVLERILFNFEV